MIDQNLRQTGDAWIIHHQIMCGLPKFVNQPRLAAGLNLPHALPLAYFWLRQHCGGSLQYSTSRTRREEVEDRPSKERVVERASAAQGPVRS
ncbi:MAG TPA: hypothetical protein VG713_12130, partial [Pirellulales bacterium]|nr:hypothetical protein [Pirellulales bacterium]